MKLAALVLAVAAVQPISKTRPKDAIAIDDAGAFAGKMKTVCGFVVDSQTRRPGFPTATQLALARDIQMSATGAVLIRDKDRGNFSALFDKLIIGREICVNAHVALNNGQPVLGVVDAENFRYVGPLVSLDPAFAPGVERKSGSGVTHPKATRQRDPQYTHNAMKAKITGRVEVEVVVGVDGKPGDMRITRSLDPLFGLDEAALRATAEWRFKPATQDGVPVAFVVTLEFTFDLH